MPNYCDHADEESSYDIPLREPDSDPESIPSSIDSRPPSPTPTYSPPSPGYVEKLYTSTQGRNYTLRLYPHELLGKFYECGYLSVKMDMNGQNDVLDGGKKYEDHELLIDGEYILRVQQRKLEKWFKMYKQNKTKPAIQPPPYYTAQCILYGLPHPKSEQSAFETLRTICTPPDPPKKQNQQSKKGKKGQQNQIPPAPYGSPPPPKQALRIPDRLEKFEEEMDEELDNIWAEAKEAARKIKEKRVMRNRLEARRSGKREGDELAKSRKKDWKSFLKQADEELGKGWRWPEGEANEQVEKDQTGMDVTIGESFAVEGGEKIKAGEETGDARIGDKRPAEESEGLESGQEKKLKGEELDISEISTDYLMCRLGFFSPSGKKIPTPIPDEEVENAHYRKYTFDTLSLSLTRKNGFMGNLESDLMAQFHFETIPKRVGETIRVSWRGKNYYMNSFPDRDAPENEFGFFVGHTPKEEEATSGKFTFLGKGWLKGEFGIPGIGISRFIARPWRENDCNRKHKHTIGTRWKPRMLGVRYWERIYRWCADLEENDERLGCLDDYRCYPDRWKDQMEECDSLNSSEEDPDEDYGLRPHHRGTRVHYIKDGEGGSDDGEGKDKVGEAVIKDEEGKVKEEEVEKMNDVEGLVKEEEVGKKEEGEEDKKPDVENKENVKVDVKAEVKVEGTA
ncbi:hypothetical protein M231_06267 [Tremella mesenterica]|uniref:Uncharacterized protein n=1 Tax=Tremella mesenterica TaxID=5217 RepID=A0A4Q1BGG2_TREME|nr:uncharacterized protein TREMEDRAFT_65047 [Tremella mesenterica DSM 1558]EIW66664.1 hypothetical protein TREMEDRAFT_65047 [Tremella mesenterica DSM 1558]RXK36483.1 hypothetical protein M231_06267 [Tremella mesenterica]